MTPEPNSVVPGASAACPAEAPSLGQRSYPVGVFTLQGILERNAEYIVPTAWRELGAPEALRRLREMQRKNLLERKALLERCENDPIAQEEERVKCAEDLVYFLSHYAFIYNADARQKIPFLPLEIQVHEVLYPFYKDQYEPFDEENPEADTRNHMVEKPRKVGITWCVVASQAWGMCFHHRWPFRTKGTPYVALAAADVKENATDRSNPESHMGRMEQILLALPPWMLPGPIRPAPEELEERAKDPKAKKRLKGDTFGENKVSFPENKSFFWVKALSRNIGRSVRFSNALVDEEEFAEGASAGVRSLMDATKCLWRISSVEGKNNSFARDFENPRLKVSRHRIRYWHVPWYDDAWLKVQRENRSEEGFQKEILCNRNASGGKLFWAPPWDERKNVVSIPLPILPDQTLWISLDIGKADGLAIEYFQRNPAAETVDCHGMVFRRDATLEWMIPFLLGKFPEKNLVGDPMPPRSHWHPQDQEFVGRVGRYLATAPHVRYVAGSDASEERMHADSLITQMRRMWKVIIIPVKLLDKGEAIDAVKWMLPYLRIEDKVNALTPGQYDSGDESPFTFSDMFYGYRKQVNRQTDEILPSGKPVHDRFSNPADGLQYAVHEMPRVMRRTPTEVERMNKARATQALEERKRSSAVTVFRNVFGRRALA